MVYAHLQVSSRQVQAARGRKSGVLSAPLHPGPEPYGPTVHDEDFNDDLFWGSEDALTDP